MNCFLLAVNLIIKIHLLNTQNESNYDIVVVGGGATGIIQTHFLMEQYPDLNIMLIENKRRIGGRTFSSNISYTNNNNTIQSTITIEGGAEVTNYNKLLYQILSYLNLCDDLIPVTYQPPPIYYFRRQYQYNTVLWNKFYNFTAIDTEYAYNNPDPFNKTYLNILHENNNGLPPQNQSQWVEFFTNWTLNNIPVYKFCLRSILRTFSNASIEFSKYRLDTEFGWDKEANLAQYLWYYYGNKQQINSSYVNESYFHTIRNGYQSMINKFYEKIKSNQQNNLNHKIFLYTKLIGVDYNTDSKYKYKLEIKNMSDNTIAILNVSKIILSIDPMNLLQILPKLKPIYNDYTTHLLDILIPTHLYKINLIYNSEFWISEDLISLSHSSTNLEINEIQIRKIWSNDTLTTIQIYASSSDKSDFWNELQILGDPYVISKNVLFDTSSLIIASDMVVKCAVNQLSILLQKSIPLPVAAFVYPWGSNNTYYDGLNNFKFNVKNLIQIIDNINQPNKNEEIYIAVSDYTLNMSNYQHAAYKTGLNNIIKNFNVTNPFGPNQPQCPPTNKMI
eukprot:330178_1